MMLDDSLVRKKRRAKKLLGILVLVVILIFLLPVLSSRPTLEENYQKFRETHIAMKVYEIGADHGYKCFVDKSDNIICPPAQVVIRASIGDSLWKLAMSDTVWIYKYKLYEGYSEKTFQIVTKK